MSSAADAAREPAGELRAGLDAPLDTVPTRGRRPLRLLALLAVLCLVGFWPEGRVAAAGAMADAYVAVTVFVAATLLLLYALERRSGVSFTAILEKHRRFEVPIAAAFGALPGCGGAIAAISQYTRGHLSFGGVVATLTATMGDAMFVLLAAEPGTAGLVLVVSFVVGVISGYVINAIHGTEFMRPARQTPPPERLSDHELPGLRSLDGIWLVLLVPGLFLGLCNAFQVEPGWALPYGVLAGVLCLLMWAFRGGRGLAGHAGIRGVIADTNFVTVWVFVAFLSYELAVVGLGLDLAAFFAATAGFVPLIAILVGFIPGCGPQIVVTSLYVSGAVPLSAQIGNAIANDGDALFPALASAPKGAALATVYSAVPALIVAYAWWALFEGGL